MTLRPRTNLLLATVVSALVVSTIMVPSSRTAFFSNNVELPLYDLHTSMSWPWKPGHPDIILVTIQKENARRWPLRDGELAEALETILLGGAAVVAVDIIRPEFRDDNEFGPANLRRIAQTAPIVWARSDGGPPDDEFPAPRFLREMPLGRDFEKSRAGLAHFPLDQSLNPKVRRGYVAIDGGELMSLPTLAASFYCYGNGLSQDEILERLKKIGSLSPTAGGYNLRPGEGEEGIGDQFLIKFGPNSDQLFPVVSLAEVKRAAADPSALEELFEGKIVFFGTHDTSTAKDEVPVIGDPSLRGVKLHALATAQLVREVLDGEPPIRIAPGWLKLLLIPVFSVLAAVVITVIILRTRSLRSAWLSAPFVLAIPALVFALGSLAISNGLWLPVGAPLVASATTGGIALAWLIRFQRRDLASAEEVLRRSTGSQRAKVLWEHRDELLAGKSLPSATFEGTILFSDLADSTRASHQLEAAGGPEAYRRWHDAYMDRVTELVNAHGSSVDAYLGDGVMVRFGDTRGRDSGHTDSAVRCALAMREMVEELNEHLEPDEPVYRVRIGIYTGPINLSQRGSGGQIDYAHSGTAVNLAKRLEEFDKQSFGESGSAVRILISKRTHQLLDPEIERSPVSSEPLLIDKNTPPVIVWQIEDSPKKSCKSPQQSR